MAVLTTGHTFVDGQQVTSDRLNNIANEAAFEDAAVDGTTTQLSSGAIIVKDLGISAGKIAASAVTTAKLATNSVSTAKIIDGNVTKAKIENLADYKVLGNVSGGAAAPAEVAILDEDNMASNSATSLATQQSIKAYADSKVDGTGAGSFTTLAASGIVSVADGSESAPAITNTGDTNTGIYFPAENSVALTSGAGATLTSTNVAITIAVPTSIVSTAQSDLTLQGGDANSKNLIFKKASAQQGKIAAVGDELKFYAGTSVTESLEITTTGVVVPGDIDVDGTTNLDVVDIDGAVDMASTLTIDGDLTVKGGGTGSIVVNDEDSSLCPTMTFLRNGGGTTGNDFIKFENSSGEVAAINATGGGYFSGNVGIGTIFDPTTSPSNTLHVVNTTSSGAYIQYDGQSNTEFGLRIESNVSGGNFEGDFANNGSLLDLFANSSVTSGGDILACRTQSSTPVMLVKGSGNVGIGTASPSKSLVVNENDSECVIVVTSSDSGTAGIYFGDQSDEIIGGVVFDNSTDKLQLRSSNNNTAVTIDSSERVGIGDSTPSYKLDVNGTGHFVNDLTLDEELIHNLGGDGALPGYSANGDSSHGTRGCVIDDAGVNGSTIYVARRNSWALHLASDTGSQGSPATVVRFADMDEQGSDGAGQVGSITITPSATAYNTSSDYRLKENDVAIIDGIDRLKQLSPYRFNFKRDADTTVDGFFAHEVSDIVPEAITGTKDAMKDQEYEVSPAVYEDVVHPAVEATYDEDGQEITPAQEEYTESVLVTEAVRDTRSVPDYQGIDQSKLIPLLTAALQEAVAKIEALEARVQTLEG